MPVGAGSKEAAASALVKLNIEVGPDEDEAALGQALALAQDGAFWAKHAAIHPNGKRLSFWLWVHGKYRCVRVFMYVIWIASLLLYVASGIYHLPGLSFIFI